MAIILIEWHLGVKSEALSGKSKASERVYEIDCLNSKGELTDWWTLSLPALGGTSTWGRLELAKQAAERWEAERLIDELNKLIAERNS